MSVKCLVQDPPAIPLKPNMLRNNQYKVKPCTVKVFPKENTLLSIMSFIFKSGLKLLSTYKLIDNREEKKKKEIDALIDLEFENLKTV